MKTFVIIFSILLSVSYCSAFEPVTFKDWFVADGDGFIYASTMNKSGNVLGQYCYTKDLKCYYVIAIDAACNKGDKYPVLINSDSGAISKQIICDEIIKDQSTYRYYIKYDDINDLIPKSNKIGFALPMQSDDFRAIRFSLDGAADAITFMLKLFNAATPSKTTLDKNTDNTSF